MNTNQNTNDTAPVKRGRKAKYPFANMKVNDSFFAENKNVRLSAYAYGKRHNMVFTGKTEQNGVRITRTA